MLCFELAKVSYAGYWFPKLGNTKELTFTVPMFTVLVFFVGADCIRPLIQSGSFYENYSA